ncbi:MAG: HypC/HybG/HupF family hydrogenase formation chaperone [Bacteroidia bacterium]|nr:HypC/HybG/HupF family hydrogenase formation chaperone [Bacteroidia bacterium]
MCLSIPAMIVSIDGSMAEVSAGGTIFKAGLHMIENAIVGDYILLHAGFAIQKISEKEAAETIKLFEEMKNALNE